MKHIFYKIESGIPLAACSNAKSKARVVIEMLKVGQSTLIRRKELSRVGVHRTGVETGRKFATRSVNGAATRVWRMK